MNTLIIYATKHGSVEKCSKMLAEKLRGKVDLYNLKGGRAPELKGYDKVIIGGSIYAGRVQKDVTEFCSKNLNNLKDKKVGLFICCIFENNAAAQISSSFPQELIKSSVVKESFGGEMKFGGLSFFERAITRMVSKMSSKENSSMPPIDTSKDMLTISEKRIDVFAHIMNNA